LFYAVAEVCQLIIGDKTTTALPLSHNTSRQLAPPPLGDVTSANMADKMALPPPATPLLYGGRWFDKERRFSLIPPPANNSE